MSSPSIKPPHISIELLALFGLLLVTSIISLKYANNVNVSLLLMEGIRSLEGETLYRDMMEVNPPASFLLYMPAAWLEYKYGIKGEASVLIMTTALIAFSIVASSRLIFSKKRSRQRSIWIITAFIAFCLVAEDTFSEREHIALVLMLPWLSLLSIRLDGKNHRDSIWNGLYGLMAGMAICIKPHFAAALAIPMVYFLFLTRSYRSVLNIENITLAIIFIIYISAFRTMYPEYLDNIYQVALDVYIPERIPTLRLLAPILTCAYCIAGYIYISRNLQKGVDKSYQAIFILASLGFAIASIIQGKGWPYHHYPSIALILFVVVDDALNRAYTNALHTDPHRYFLSVITATVLLTFSAWEFWPPKIDTLQFKDTVLESHEAPSILAISEDIAQTIPLTRRVKGKYIAKGLCCFITATAYRLLINDPKMEPSKVTKLRGWIIKDRQTLTNDIKTKKPDFIVMDTGDFWKQWINEDANLSTLLCSYQKVRQTPKAELYARRQIEPTGTRCAADWH